MSDSQKNRAYAWESSFKSFNEHSVPRLRLRRLIRSAERRYRIPPVTIEFMERVRKHKRYAKIASEYIPETHTITLGWNDHNYAIALHEVSHAIVDYILGYELEPHGPHWLGVYMWLLGWAKVAPTEALEASARVHGLTWCSAGKIGPEKIRTTYRRMVRIADENRDV